MNKAVILLFLPILLLATIKCPYCGAENPDNAKFCWKCGKPLKVALKGEKMEKKKAVEKEEKKNVVVCPYCGAENPPEAKFCWKCGKPLLKKIEKKSRRPMKEQSNISVNQALLDSILTELRDLKKEIRELKSMYAAEKAGIKRDKAKKKDSIKWSDIFLAGCVTGVFLLLFLAALSS